MADYYRETEKTIEKAKLDYLKKKVPERVLSETESREREAEGAFQPIFDEVLREYDQFMKDLTGFWNICRLLDDDSGGFNYILDDWNINFRGERGEKIVEGATDDEDNDIDSDNESSKDEIVVKKEEEEEAAAAVVSSTEEEPPIKKEKLTEEDPPASLPN